ncbi:MAG: type toxin-antitoxin system HicB family antitoxin, partial [Chloroflexi bacterium]|nr:type toxin-antitoxin system HicB family antitoxin [Chloroflexota bacterium]
EGHPEAVGSPLPSGVRVWSRLQPPDRDGDDLRHAGRGSGPRGVMSIAALLGSRPGWYIARVIFTIEIDREDDGRWLAEVPALSGVMAYGQDRDEAVARVQALALRVIAERLEHREAPAEFLNVTFQAA